MSASFVIFFFSSRRRHTRSDRDWSSDVCSSDLSRGVAGVHAHVGAERRVGGLLVRPADGHGGIIVGACGRVIAQERVRVSRLHQRSEEHTSELQSRSDLVCRLLLEKKKKKRDITKSYEKHTSELQSRSDLVCTLLAIYRNHLDMLTLGPIEEAYGLQCMSDQYYTV